MARSLPHENTSAARQVARDNAAYAFRMVSGAARPLGIIDGENYSLFHRAGVRGLYDGRDSRGMREKKGQSHTQEYLDFAGVTELRLNTERLKRGRAVMRRLQSELVEQVLAVPLPPGPRKDMSDDQKLAAARAMFRVLRAARPAAIDSFGRAGRRLREEFRRENHRLPESLPRLKTAVTPTPPPARSRIKKTAAPQVRKPAAGASKQLSFAL
jgi:hypothetical protein